LKIIKKIMSGSIDKMFDLLESTLEANMKHMRETIALYRKHMVGVKKVVEKPAEEPALLVPLEEEESSSSDSVYREIFSSYSSGEEEPALPVPPSADFVYEEIYSSEEPAKPVPPSRKREFEADDEEEISYYSEETAKKAHLDWLNGTAHGINTAHISDDEENYDEDGGEDDVDIDLLGDSADEDPVSETDVNELNYILKNLKSYTLKSLTVDNAWWQRTFQDTLDRVRDNLGYQGSNQRSLEVYDALVEGKAYIRKSFVASKEKCCFCSLKRSCRHTLWINDKKQGFIGSKCATLAKSLIDFYSAIHRIARTRGCRGKEALVELKQLHGQIFEAQAGKKRIFY